MRNIQIVLLAMFLVGTVLYLTRNRSRLIDRVFVLAFALSGITLVCFPEMGDWLATALGVGRGADAVIYFMLVFLSYVCLQLYAKLRQQDARMVELARSVALQNAKSPEAFDDSLPHVMPMVEARNLRPVRWHAESGENELNEFESFAKAG